MATNYLTAHMVSGHDPPASSAPNHASGSRVDHQGFTRPRPTTSAQYIQPEKE